MKNYNSNSKLLKESNKLIYVTKDEQLLFEYACYKSEGKLNLVKYNVYNMYCGDTDDWSYCFINNRMSCVYPSPEGAMHILDQIKENEKYPEFSKMDSTSCITFKEFKKINTQVDWALLEKELEQFVAQIDQELESFIKQFPKEVKKIGDCYFKTIKHKLDRIVSEVLMSPYSEPIDFDDYRRDLRQFKKAKHTHRELLNSLSQPNYETRKMLDGSNYALGNKYSRELYEIIKNKLDDNLFSIFEKYICFTYNA